MCSLPCDDGAGRVRNSQILLWSFFVIALTACVLVLQQAFFTFEYPSRRAQERSVVTTTASPALGVRVPRGEGEELGSLVRALFASETFKLALRREHEEVHAGELREWGRTRHDGGAGGAVAPQTSSGCVCSSPWVYQGNSYPGTCERTEDSPGRAWCYYNISVPCVGLPATASYDYCDDGDEFGEEKTARFRQLDYWDGIALPADTPVIELRRFERHRRTRRMAAMEEAAIKLFARAPPVGCDIPAASRFSAQRRDPGELTAEEIAVNVARQQSLDHHLPRVVRAMRRHGLPPIIASGTVLSFHRECGAISGDRDGDFWAPRSYFPTQMSFKKFAEAMPSSGYGVRTTHHNHGSAGWQFVIYPLPQPLKHSELVAGRKALVKLKGVDNAEHFYEGKIDTVHISDVAADDVPVSTTAGALSPRLPANATNSSRVMINTDLSSSLEQKNATFVDVTIIDPAGGDDLVKLGLDPAMLYRSEADTEFSGAYFDVFVVDEDYTTGGCQAHPCRWTAYLTHSDGIVRRCVSNPTSFSLVAWLGTTMWAPTNYVPYLESEYGDQWRVPGGGVYKSCYRTGLPDWVSNVDVKAPRSMGYHNNLDMPSASAVLALQDKLESDHHDALDALYRSETSFRRCKECTENQAKIPENTSMGEGQKQQAASDPKEKKAEVTVQEEEEP